MTDARHPQALATGLRTALDRHRSRSDVECLGENPDQLAVRGSVDRAGTDPDTERVTMEPRETRSRRAGLDMDPQEAAARRRGDPPVGLGEIRASLSRRG